MFEIGWLWVNGLVLGLEHVLGDDDEDWTWGIVLQFLCLRIWFFKLKEPPDGFV